MHQAIRLRVSSKGAGELGDDEAIVDMSGADPDVSSVDLNQSGASASGNLPDDDADSSLLTVDDRSVAGSALTPIAVVKGQRPIPVQALHNPYPALVTFIIAMTLTLSGSIEIARKEADLSNVFNISQDTGDTICGGLVGAGLVGLAAGAYTLWRTRPKPAENSVNRAINIGYGSFNPG
ncbi:MAG: hypothetical protein K0R66_157 [Gammaproteobacteria bacterium]|jgi:hypothetical protein|nr:hypothetical protein [Gammaproteobacteria bacterium]